jgi:hypothetical protein
MCRWRNNHCQRCGGNNCECASDCCVFHDKSPFWLLVANLAHSLLSFVLFFKAINRP